MSVLFRTAGAVTAAALLAAAAASIWARQQEPQAATAPGLAPPAISRLPATDRLAGSSLIERSPFAQDRSAFARNAGPPPAEIQVKLTGVFKVGKEMRASLLIGGQSIAVKKGDQTPVGIVAEIENSAVTLAGPTPRRIEMFKQ